jgi:hypothetical protein
LVLDHHALIQRLSGAQVPEKEGETEKEKVKEMEMKEKVELVN